MPCGHEMLRLSLSSYWGAEASLPHGQPDIHARLHTSAVKSSALRLTSSRTSGSASLM